MLTFIIGIVLGHVLGILGYKYLREYRPFLRRKTSIDERRKEPVKFHSTKIQMVDGKKVYVPPAKYRK